MAATVKKIDSKTITLSLKERISLSGILPQEGDYSFLIVKRDILKKIAVSQDELKKFEIKTVQGEKGQGSFLTWNAKGEKEKFNYSFTDLEKNELKLALKKLSDDKKLTEDLLGLYEIFVN